MRLYNVVEKSIFFFPAFSLTTDERAGQEKDVEGRGTRKRRGGEWSVGS